MLKLASFAFYDDYNNVFIAFLIVFYFFDAVFLPKVYPRVYVSHYYLKEIERQK